MGLPPSKLSSFLQLVKKDLGLKILRAYSIPMNAESKMDTEAVQLTPDWSTTISLEHPDKPAVVVHSINLGHRNQLHHITTLSTKP
jgi:hypothetical protein